MLDSPIIGLAIGLAFLFAALATLASAFTEAIAQFLGLRGAFLLRGLRSLVDGSDTGDSSQLKKLFEMPILKNLGKSGPILGDQLEKAQKVLSFGDLKDKRGMPSYVSSRAFAAGVIDLVVPDGMGKTDMNKIITGIEKLPNETEFKSQLQSLAKSSASDIETFRKNVEVWYDEHMDRVSGWYKRYTRWITALVGAVIVIGLNVQVFAFAQSLYTDQALSQTVVAKAIAADKCDNTDPSKCIEQAREQLQALEPGLSLGWQIVPACQTVKTLSDGNTLSSTAPHCSFWGEHGFTDPNSSGSRDFRVALTLILGWLITIVALIPGARFWYDLINQLGSLRGSGPKPVPSTKQS